MKNCFSCFQNCFSFVFEETLWHHFLWVCIHQLQKAQQYTLCIYSEPNRLFKDTSGMNCVGLFPPLKTTIWPNQAPFSYPLSPNVITSAHKYTAANLQSCSGHNRNYYLLLSLSLCFVQLFDLLSAQPCNFCAFYLWQRDTMKTIFRPSVLYIYGRRKNLQ